MAGEDTSQPPPPLIASLEAPQMVSSIKLRILKKGKYILWTMKIEQYLAHIDYALWEKAPAALMNLMLLIVLLLLQAIVLMHKQIDQDDLEEMDLKWQVAMLSIRVKQFYKKTRRKLEFNGKEPVGFDKTKVECFNCHRRGHFARDCRSARNSGNKSRDPGNAWYRGRDNEEEATDFAVMAFTSNPSSSFSSNSESNVDAARLKLKMFKDVADVAHAK
nr:ribonuclease H-like domain-containing protein [Tanacetum cinerariifolium]GEY51444.1 ribonuclease H-like domain-containing protein [Tanacetum cinerariifolium]GEY51451.1 ribonuclease H-like domain-containing protein [Tanacetum cinerariifolium]